MSANPGIPTAAELAEQTLKALSPTGFGIRLSPALPAGWPPRSGNIEWFAYRITALPTGVISYAVNGPVAKVSMELKGRKTQVERISETSVDGRYEEDGLVKPELGPAQQALFEVVLGRRLPDSARHEMRAYAGWSAAASTIGEDIRRRKPEFFRWIDAQP